MTAETTETKWNLISTHNFDAIQKHCNSARQRTTLLAVVGYAGAGKTTALEHYHENNANTYLVTCARAMKSKQFLSSILLALDIYYLASDYEMCQKIIVELKNKKGSLLMIDEASKLSPNALMYVQDIFDGIEGTSGIIIAGVEYLYENIKKSAEKNKVGMPEFFSRVGQWLELEPPTPKEIEAICLNNDFTDKEKIKLITRLKNFRMTRNSIQNLKTA